MKLTIDVSKPLSSGGYNDPAVLAAMIQLYVARTHGDAVFKVPPGVSFPQSDSIAGIGDRLMGKAGDTKADLSFDVHETPSREGVTSPELYHALSTIYAWYEYNWSDVDLDSISHNLDRDDAIADTIDGLASDFGISELDWYTKNERRERSLIEQVEPPSPTP